MTEKEFSKNPPSVPKELRSYFHKKKEWEWRINDHRLGDQRYAYNGWEIRGDDDKVGITFWLNCKLDSQGRIWWRIDWPAKNVSAHDWEFPEDFRASRWVLNPEKLKAVIVALQLGGQEDK